MKKIITHFPTLVLCAFYRILSLVFKFKTSLSMKFYQKYEDKLFTVFNPYVISKGLFTPFPSNNYKFRHGMAVGYDADFFDSKHKEILEEMKRKLTDYQNQQ